MTWWASVNKDKTQENQLSESWSWEAVYAEGTLPAWDHGQVTNTSHFQCKNRSENTYKLVCCSLKNYWLTLMAKEEEDDDESRKKKRRRKKRKRRRSRSQLTRANYLFSVKINLVLKPITCTCVISIINNVGLPPHLAGENLSFLCKLFLIIFHEIWKIRWKDYSIKIVFVGLQRWLSK